ncbi:MAG: ISAzo13-like element transposase-related protein, partial [Bacteroidota bacterium]
LFSYISQNWRGKPLISYEVIINLIASTKTTKGLEVECEIDINSYEKGIKISDKEMAQINIEKETFHGDWNYRIKPS